MLNSASGAAVAAGLIELLAGSAVLVAGSELNLLAASNPGSARALWKEPFLVCVHTRTLIIQEAKNRSECHGKAFSIKV